MCGSIQWVDLGAANRYENTIKLTRTDIVQQLFIINVFVFENEMIQMILVLLHLLEAAIVQNQFPHSISCLVRLSDTQLCSGKLNFCYRLALIQTLTATTYMLRIIINFTFKLSD